MCLKEPQSSSFGFVLNLVFSKFLIFSTGTDLFASLRGYGFKPFLRILFFQFFYPHPPIYLWKVSLTFSYTKKFRIPIFNKLLNIALFFLPYVTKGVPWLYAKIMLLTCQISCFFAWIMKCLILSWIFLLKIPLAWTNPAPRQCSDNSENSYYVESIYFDLSSESKPIENFIGKLEHMIAYIDLDDGYSRSSYPTSPVRI